MTLLWFLALSFVDPVEVWVAQEAAKIKEIQEVKAPSAPQQLEILVNHVFLTRRLTSDQTTLPTDWGRLTSDGVAVDTWDLTERFRQLGEALEWPVGVAETDDGPIFIVGHQEKAVGTLVHQGKRGYWDQWHDQKPLPEPLSLSSWQNVLQARQALLEVQAGNRQKLEMLKISNVLTPTLALCLLERQKDVSFEQLERWSRRWPKIDLFLIRALQAARLNRDQNGFDRLWEDFGEKSLNPEVLFQGALWAHWRGQKDLASTRLNKLLSQSPYHVRALRLHRYWNP